jgi:hypothetical protein
LIYGLADGFEEFKEFDKCNKSVQIQCSVIGICNLISVKKVSHKNWPVHYSLFALLIGFELNTVNERAKKTFPKVPK